MSRRAPAATASFRQAVDHPRPLRRNPDASRSRSARDSGAPVQRVRSAPHGSTGSDARPRASRCVARSASRPGRSRRCRDRSACTALPERGNARTRTAAPPRFASGHLGEQPKCDGRRGRSMQYLHAPTEQAHKGSRGWGAAASGLPGTGVAALALLRLPKYRRLDRPARHRATALDAAARPSGGRPAGAREDVRDRSPKQEPTSSSARPSRQITALLGRHSHPSAH